MFFFSQDVEGERDVTTYTVLILDKNSAHINDLSPDTTYMFRVQTLSSEGNPGSYSAEHEFHTLPLGTSKFKISTQLIILSHVCMLILYYIICTAVSQIQNNSTMVLGAVVGVAVMLLIVVAVLLLRKRLVALYIHI